ncbi:MAG: hypothetical protein Q7J98_08250 [Kiritimatiellia bacterium]|nr:hypothetical protein [Kiritimatiellia bacterium]
MLVLSVRFISLIVVAGSVLAGAEMPATAPGSGDDWSFPEQAVEDNGYRGRVVLNGFWSKRKLDDNSVALKARVPETRTSPKDVFEYVREFSLPQGWENRKLMLETGGFATDGIVYLDGREIVKITKGRH